MLETFGLTLSNVATLLIFMVIGYFFRRHHELPKEAGNVLALLCVLLFTPAYTISSISSIFTVDVLWEKLVLVGYGAAFVTVAILLGFLLSKPFSRTKLERNSLIYAFAIPNYGYFGYPVIEGVFGNEVLGDVIIFLIPLSLVTSSFGYALFMGEKKFSLKRILATPLVIALGIGIALGLTQLPLPGFLTTALSKAGNCMGPCSMLLAGFLLGKLPLKQLLTGWRPYVYSLIRLVAIPVIFGVLLFLAGAKEQYLMFPLLIAGIPLGLNLVVYPQSRGFEDQAVANAKLCFVSYLLSLGILPVTFALLVHLSG